MNTEYDKWTQSWDLRGVEVDIIDGLINGRRPGI
jgi:hypothetical protein